MSKYLIHVKTGDFEFIETEVEGDVADALLLHKRLTTAITEPTAGLPVKEWNRILDDYLNDLGMEGEAHEKMNASQKWLIHELDKANSRINNK